MRISDWSSDVCSSDLDECRPRGGAVEAAARLLQGPRGRAFLALHPRRQPSPERGPPGGGGVSRPRRLRHAFVKTMPPRLEAGVLYAAPEHPVLMPLRASRCGKDVDLPLSPTTWPLTY